MNKKEFEAFVKWTRDHGVYSAMKAGDVPCFYNHWKEAKRLGLY